MKFDIENLDFRCVKFKPLFPRTDIWSDFSDIMKTIFIYTLWWVVKGIKFEGHFEIFFVYFL